MLAQKSEGRGRDQVKSRVRVLASPSACTHSTSQPFGVSALLRNPEAKRSTGGNGRAEPKLKISQGTQTAIPPSQQPESQTHWGSKQELF